MLMYFREYINCISDKCVVLHLHFAATQLARPGLQSRPGRYAVAARALTAGLFGPALWVCSEVKAKDEQTLDADLVNVEE